MQRVLVIGGNRGIGYELVSRLRGKGHEVYATFRPSTKDDPSIAKLRETATGVIELDLQDEQSIKLAAEDFGDRSLEILINCAGVYNLWDDKPFTEHTSEDFISFFKTNVVGPFLTAKYFLPALKRSEGGRIINVSSDMASIADNTGGNACYRVAKCALNQLTKTQAMDLQKLDLPGIKTLAVHPGYVATKMTNFYGEDDMNECMNGLVRVIENFGEDPDIRNGGYVKWDGTQMPY